MLPLSREFSSVGNAEILSIVIIRMCCNAGAQIKFSWCSTVTRNRSRPGENSIKSMATAKEVIQYRQEWSSKVFLCVCIEGTWVLVTISFQIHSYQLQQLIEVGRKLQRNFVYAGRCSWNRSLRCAFLFFLHVLITRIAVILSLMLAINCNIIRALQLQKRVYKVV